jgi:hypothetical protein
LARCAPIANQLPPAHGACGGAGPVAGDRARVHGGGADAARPVTRLQGAAGACVAGIAGRVMVLAWSSLSDGGAGGAS